MAYEERIIYVYADWFGGSPVPFGKLYVNYIRGNELTSFSFSDNWLKSENVGIQGRDGHCRIYARL